MIMFSLSLWLHSRHSKLEIFQLLSDITQKFDFRHTRLIEQQILCYFNMAPYAFFFVSLNHIICIVGCENIVK